MLLLLLILFIFGGVFTFFSYRHDMDVANKSSNLIMPKHLILNLVT